MVKDMIEVYAEYVNRPSSNGDDFFIWKKIEVKGHAQHTGYDTNRLVCAGISSILGGIKELMSFSTYHIEVEHGHFLVETNVNVESGKRHNIVVALGGKEFVYALETIIWQLQYMYENYKPAFKKFELVDVKGKYEDETTNNKQHKPYKQRRCKMGIYSSQEGECS